MHRSDQQETDWLNLCAMWLTFIRVAFLRTSLTGFSYVRNTSVSLGLLSSLRSG